MNKIMKNELIENKLALYSRPRNQIIASLLSKTKYVEEIGSGINRIKNAMNDAGLSEPIFEYNYSFMTILNDKTGGVGVPENVPEKRLKDILEIIRKDNQINVSTLAKMFNVNEKTIKRDITKLKEKGILKRIGPDKGGHWEIVDNKDKENKKEDNNGKKEK